MPGKRWDEKELKQLRRQWEENGDLQAIKIRGRTGNSIKRKLIREGLLQGPAGAARAMELRLRRNC